LTEENINRILDVYANRQGIAGQARNDEAYKHFAALVPNSQIAANDYNIAVSSYVEQEDTREVVDITKLNAKITEIVKRQEVLRKAIDEIVNSLEL